MEKPKRYRSPSIKNLNSARLSRYELDCIMNVVGNESDKITKEMQEREVWQ
jgi:hypothetical protein